MARTKKKSVRTQREERRAKYAASKLTVEQLSDALNIIACSDEVPLIQVETGDPGNACKLPVCGANWSDDIKAFVHNQTDNAVVTNESKQMNGVDVSRTAVNDNETSFIQDEQLPGTSRSHKSGTSTLHKRKLESEVQSRRKISKREHEANRYQNDPIHREKKKMSAKEAWRNKYTTVLTFKNQEKQRRRERYRNDEACNSRTKMQNKTKYTQDKSYQKRKQLASVQKYAHDDVHRSKLKASNTQKYLHNDKHRSQKKALSILKYAKNYLHKLKVKTASKDRYRTDKVHKQALQAAFAKRYREDKEFRTRHSSQASNRFNTKYRLDMQFKNKVKCRVRICDLEQPRQRQERAARQKQKQRQHQSTMDLVIERFRHSVQEGPQYVCCVCFRLEFKDQVRQCHPDKLCTNVEMTERCISRKYQHDCSNQCTNACPRQKLWICHCCHSHLKKGSCPPQAHANSLSLEHIPDDLMNLNTLEQQLIAKMIPFTKIVSLPRGGLQGVKGPTVCVPSDITQTTTVLPRPQKEVDIIPVKLKRKIEFKGHVDYKMVDTQKVQRALNFLVCENPHYKDVEINENWQDDRTELHELISGNHLEAEQVNETEVGISADDGDGDIPDDDLNGIRRQLRGVTNDSCLQPVDLMTVVQADLENTIFSIAPAEGHKPVSIFGNRVEDVEAMAFPNLFPHATNTYLAEREKKLSLGRYFNERLHSADMRFASNAPYIFTAQWMTELDKLQSSISINMRKGSMSSRAGEKITANMLSDKSNMQQILKSDRGFCHLEALRGSPSYWKKTLNDLFAMIRQLGIPTWFLTFSAAELSRWPEVIECIEAQKGNNVEFSRMDWNEKCESLRSNPVTAVRMFQHRVKEFVTNVLKSKSEPIGKITDFFYRFEAQSRGSLHIHCIAYVEGAPRLGIDTDVEICAFVDKYISTELPDEQEDHELHKIVKSVQTHGKKHSNSCKKGTKTCRYNFPKCPAKETFINKQESSNTTESDGDDEMHNEAVKKANTCLKKMAEILSTDNIDNVTLDELLSDAEFGDYAEFQNALKKIATKNEIILKRRVQDVWINGYNKDLLRAWNANMDIQFIVDPYTCVMYILSYISKAEHELGEILRNAYNELQEKDCSQDLVAKMKKLGHVYFEHREVSVQESIVRTCGMKLTDSSRQVLFVPTENATRMSKPLSQIQKLAEENGDDDNVWQTSKEDRYKARPKSQDFEEMCQASFYSEYRLLAKQEASQSKNKAHVFQLLDNNGYVMKRTRGNDAVIRFTKFSETKDPEKYHSTALKLFLPFREKAQLKPPGFETYTNFYRNGNVRLSKNSALAPVKTIVDRNRAKFEVSTSELDTAYEAFQQNGPLKDAWSQVAPQADQDNRETIAERADEELDPVDANDVPELAEQAKERTGRSLVSFEWMQDTMKPMLRAMNPKQKDIFFHVQDWCEKVAQGKNPDPFHIHATGGAGTGKSHLIKCIYHMATKVLKDTNSPEDVKVLLTAPTGTAAFNIGGFTVHSAFKIPITCPSTYQGLSNESLNTMRSQLEGLQILIVDEVSMISAKTLAYIHGRLKQIKHIPSTTRDADFGRVSILAVGDFYQLPPVRATAVCIPNRTSGADLWNDNFVLVSLEEIMHQKEDVAFANTLNNLRTKQKDAKLALEDKQALLSRVDRPDEPLLALHVFSRNADVDAHNSNLLMHVCDSVTSLDAKDFIKDAKTGKQRKSVALKSGKSDDLAAHLVLGIGARVMLTRNVDTADGLVNGSFGTVKQIDQQCLSSPEPTIYVEFDHEKAGKKQMLPNKSVAIKMYEELMHNQNSVTRRQFPLKLAWGSTVHKVQGMTVDEIVFNMDHIFQPGQAYVGLSRATKLSGLYLKNFKSQIIYRSDIIHENIERMKLFIPEKFPKIEDDEFTMLHHNVQGLVSKIEDLRANSDLSDIDAFAVTETWMHTDMENSVVNIPGYDVLRKDRNDGRGGVAIYVKNNLNAQPLSVLTAIECLAVRIFPQNSPSLVLITIYRSPKISANTFLPSLQLLMQQIQEWDMPNTVIMGDFNENALKDPKPLSAYIESFGFVQYVDKSTSRYGTALDLVFGRFEHYKQSTHVIPTYYSDHNAVRITLKT